MKRMTFFTALLLFSFWQNIGAHYTDSGWIDFTQPDGGSFIGRGWGDEFEYQWETVDGYRIAKDPISGFWSYATLSAEGDYTPSPYVVGKHDPVAAAIPKQLQRSEACQNEIRRRREEFNRMLKNTRLQRRGGNSPKVPNVGIQSVTTTTIQIDAILVEFNDVKHDPQYTLTNFNDMMTSAGVYTGQGLDTPHPQNKPVYGSIRDYWYDMSSGQVIFTGGVWNTSGGTINWVVLDHNKIEYDNSIYDFRSEVLAKSGYPHIPDPTRIRAIIYAGNEYDGGALNPSSQYGQYEYIDSEEFGRPTNLQQEWSYQFFKNIGVACHELGHAAFGFPDRYGTYDTSLWDLMGAGQKNGPGGEMACPATVNPFDRASETWISFQSFAGTQTAKPFSYNYSSPQIFQVAPSGNQYFLIENRRNESGGGGTFDRFLPALGILVWHVRNSTGGGVIDLIEADNSQGEAYAPEGDPFPGSTNNTNLNDFTTPNCDYTTGNSSMILHYISAPASTMTADLGSKWFGTLPLNLTWSGSVISSNLTVPTGRTLTVSGGTLPRFETGTKLTINGNLQALGSPSFPISFDRNGTSGTWGGIVFNSGSSGNVNYATIDHATQAVRINSTGNVTLDHCTIQNFTQQGVYLVNSSATVQWCTVRDAAGGLQAIYSTGGSANPTIEHCTISNAWVGIYRAGNPGNAQIRDNTISNCSNAGIQTSSYSRPEVFRNYVSGCENGVRIQNGALPNLHDNDFFYNTLGVFLEQGQPSNLKWNNFGYSGSVRNNYDVGLYVNYLTSGNSFLNSKWNNFYDGNSAVDVFNNTATQLNAQGNYWNAKVVEGNVNTSSPQGSPNPNAGPGGSTGKIATGEEPLANHALKYHLTQSYPNPLRASSLGSGARISFTLPSRSEVSLAIFDLSGRLVKQLLLASTFEPGIANVFWDGIETGSTTASAGIYFYRLEAKSLENNESFVQTNRLVLLH